MKQNNFSTTVRIYKGYSIEFIVPKKIEGSFRKQKVDINKYLSNDWFWFENILFEELEDQSISSKDFQIVFERIITDQTTNPPKGLKEEIAYDKNKLLSERKDNIESKFILEYKILRTC